MSRIPRLAVVGTGWWAAQHDIPSLMAYEGAQSPGKVVVDGVVSHGDTPGWCRSKADTARLGS